ncbi:hypothetical protein [Turicibacter sanguinis]|nr:hypothetical protein [Turicibacter sanguinis]MCU7197985.1 hypothetical protein [Turicibacter sanguinis]MDB8576086.1 hypothetical protein [Turicibacter sanguinis]MDB8578891.1 hypothetical protein [Turicibacter sanguinis]MDB8584704.1 hypothetical protein [Turicibacter sanguinis]MDB8587651.1 hypothetical protein [Turicibacter sanguinis]
MKLKLEYGAFLLSMSLMSSLMLLGIGKCLVVLIESTTTYFSLKSF